MYCESSRYLLAKNILLCVLYIFYPGIDCMFFIWFIYEESQSSNVIFWCTVASKNATCVAMNALHNENPEKQDYAIWDTA